MKPIIALFLISVSAFAQADVGTKTSIIGWSLPPGDQVAQFELALTTTNVLSLSNNTNTPAIAIASIRLPGTVTQLQITNLISLNVRSNYLVWGRTIATNAPLFNVRTDLGYSPWTSFTLIYVPPPQPPIFLPITTP